MLSLDAAHASVTALRRHYRQDHNRRLLTVEIVPPFKPMERLATLDMACDAVLGACIGVRPLTASASFSESIRALGILIRVTRRSCSITFPAFWRGGYNRHTCMDQMCPAIANGEARL
jgi:hypothetical protein